jgi:inosine-uridine nucleoside N-ribohydrolase
MVRRLIIDTDPGVDDMVAIIAALHCAESELLALTTVGGNVSLESTTRNSLRILARVGRLEFPDYAGLTAAEVHGDDGLAGCRWPDEKGGVTLARLGPLTILAAALRARPLLADGLEPIRFGRGTGGVQHLQRRGSSAGSAGKRCAGDGDAAGCIALDDGVAGAAWDTLRGRCTTRT